MTGYVYIWEFRVHLEDVPAFERAYGAGGDWESLFRRAPGYVGTLLLKDKADATRYLTIDRWQSEDDYKRFVTQHEAAYRALDSKCGNLTTEERSLGSYAL